MAARKPTSNRRHQRRGHSLLQGQESCRRVPRRGRRIRGPLRGRLRVARPELARRASYEPLGSFWRSELVLAKARKFLAEADRIWAMFDVFLGKLACSGESLT